jgi:hypothetical protein
VWPPNTQAILDALGRLLNGLPRGPLRVRVAREVLSWIDGMGGPGELFPVVQPRAMSADLRGVVEVAADLYGLACACSLREDTQPWRSRYSMVGGRRLLHGTRQ